MERISVNAPSVQNILKKLNLLTEEFRLLISDADKTIEIAELEGWNDGQYYEFKDNFYDSKQLIMNGIKRIEEEQIPMLRRIIRSADEFR